MEEKWGRGAVLLVKLGWAQPERVAGYRPNKPMHATCETHAADGWRWLQSEVGVVVLRATQKVLKLLPEPVSGPVASGTALGDWYVNRILVDRQPLLLLVSSTSRLAVVTPARNVRALPGRLAALIEERIRRLGIDAVTLALEVQATRVVRVGKTVDRSVTGQMVDFAKAIPYYLPEGEWGEADLVLVEDRLGETPCLAGGSFEDVIFPRGTAIRLLERRWSNRATH
jgi:hypothetical protein